jgi:hypothetical protein
MSTLPDLESENVGMCAFWNAVDQSTLDSINPSSAATASNANTTEVYDNGVQGEWDLEGNSNVGGYRVKSDGWIIVWVTSDDNAVYGIDDSSVTGQVDMIEAWDNVGGGTSTDALTQGINDLASNLDQWATIQPYYNAGDIGFYSFDFTNANGYTYFRSTSQSGADVTKTDGTEILLWEVYGQLQYGGTTINMDSIEVANSGPSLRDWLALDGGSMDKNKTYSFFIDSEGGNTSFGHFFIWK